MISLHRNQHLAAVLPYALLPKERSLLNLLDELRGLTSAVARFASQGNCLYLVFDGQPSIDDAGRADALLRDHLGSGCLPVFLAGH